MKNNGDIQETVRQVNELIQKASPKKGEDWQPGQVEDIFDKLESISEKTNSLSAIAELLKHPSNSVRNWLISGKSQSIPYLQYIFQNGDTEARQNAAVIIRDMEEPPFDLLEKVLLEDQEEQVKAQAAFSLAMHGENGADILREALNSSDPKTQHAVIQGIWGVVASRQKQSSQDALISLLRYALTDESYPVRLSAFDGLDRSDAVSDSEIIDALTSPYVALRRRALEPFLENGIKDLSSARLLADKLEDPEHSVIETVFKNLRGDSEQLDQDLVVSVIIKELVVRSAVRTEEGFSSEVIAKFINVVTENAPRIREQALEQLAEIAFQFSGSPRRRSIFVARRIDETDFATLVNERGVEDPDSARQILKLLGVHSDTGAIIEEISNTNPGDIQKTAQTQIKLLDQYYRDVLGQANTSFRWVIVVTAVSLTCLIVSIAFVMSSEWRNTDPQSLVVVLTGIGTVLAQFIAGTQLYLYAQTRQQLALFNRQLDQTQRFLLANSVCESLSGEAQEKARTELIRRIVMLGADQQDMLGDGEALRGIPRSTE